MNAMRNPIFLTSLILVLTNISAFGQAPSAGSNASAGSICIASVTPPNAGEKSLGNPSGGNRVSSYSVQIDKRSSVIASNEKAVFVPGLAIGRKHLVKIYGDGKLLESFWFKFSEYSSKELCLWFGALYETWHLWDAKDGGAKCRCK
jgi:hypothetical protein